MKLLHFIPAVVVAICIFFVSPSCKKTIPNAVKDTTKPAWQMIAPFNGYGANFYSSTCINDSLLVVQMVMYILWLT